MNNSGLLDEKMYAGDLTWREQDILVLLAERLTNREIADRLHLAESTIKDYVGNILSKLYVKNRREAVEQAKALGLLDQVRKTATSPKKNLPPERTPFVGRRDELTEIRQQLGKMHLLTLTGRGGIGKTRLALRAAVEMADDFKDGCFFVSLAPILSVDQIIQTISEAVKFPITTHEDPQHQLLRHLQNLQLLLVMDNFEHLLDGGNIVSEILQNAPDVKILATSRERLNLQSETILNVGGMDIPGEIGSEDSLNYDAITLFVQSANKVRPRFDPSPDELEGIVNICQVVGGMPLAIELAAAWLHIINVNEIADELKKNLDILATEVRDAPARHRSIRAVFDGSWLWLSDDEQKVFPRLSVFRGSFTREAAEQVAVASLSTLATLVDKSLLRIDPGYGETTRYDLHELVRQYAAERLLEAGQAEAVRVQEAHLHFFLSLAERAEQFLDTEQEWEWLERLEAERDNLLAALRWSTEQAKAEHAMRLNAALINFWIYNSPAGEAIDWLESSLSIEWDERSRTTMQARAKVLTVAGYATLQISDLDLAKARFQEGAELSSKLGDQDRLAWSLRGSGLVCLIRGDLAEAQTFMQESWDICQEVQNEYALAWAAYGLGDVALAHTELAQAGLLLGAALTHFRQHGRELGTFHSLISLGHLNRAQKKLTESETCYREALTIQQKNRYIHYVAQILDGMAHNAVANKKWEIAVQLLGAAQARRDTIEVARWAHHEIEYQRSLRLTQDQLPTSIWQVAWDEGYNMTPQHALEFALTDKLIT